MRHFGKASLLLEGGQASEATPRASDTSDAVYPLVAGNHARTVATITYDFDLSGLADAGARHGRLRFADSTGKIFDLPIDLTKFS